VLGAGAGLFAIAVAVTIRDVPHWNIDDLRIYRHAGLTATHSGDFYGASFGSPFTYPPFAALLFEGLDGSLAVDGWLMTGISLAALGWAAWVALGAAGFRAPASRAGLTLIMVWAALWADPVMSVFTWGQVDLLLMAVLLTDLCLGDGRWWQGTGVGLTAGFKLTPLIFIPYLLLTRRYRAALVAAGTFALTIAVSFAAVPGAARQYWLGGLFLQSQRVGYSDMLPDQSLDGLLSRLAASAHTPLSAWLGFAIVVGVGGVALAAAADRYGLRLLAVLTCAVTGLLISPISWDHHWVWIVLLPVAALGVLRARGPTAGPAMLLAMTGLFLEYPIIGGTGPSAGTYLNGLIWGTGGNPDHWHGTQDVTGNLYVLAGLAILAVVALIVGQVSSASTPGSTSNVAGVVPRTSPSASTR
jgi:alpha-1,2-mannosyltransferase